MSQKRTLDLVIQFLSVTKGREKVFLCRFMYSNRLFVSSNISQDFVKYYWNISLERVETKNYYNLLLT